MYCLNRLQWAWQRKETHSCWRRVTSVIAGSRASAASRTKPCFTKFCPSLCSSPSGLSCLVLHISWHPDWPSLTMACLHLTKVGSASPKAYLCTHVCQMVTPDSEEAVATCRAPRLCSLSTFGLISLFPVVPHLVQFTNEKAGRCLPQCLGACNPSLPRFQKS